MVHKETKEENGHYTMEKKSWTCTTELSYQKGSGKDKENGVY